MRLVVRLGGSVVASPVNTELLGKYTDLIKTVKAQGHEVAVVVGGGALAREFIGIARDLGLEMQEQDEVAISCSRLFATAFPQTARRGGMQQSRHNTGRRQERWLPQGKVVVMGGLKPGITTDAVAALVAERVKADLLVKGTDQEGVYDKYRRTNPDAVKQDRLTFGEFEKIFEGTVLQGGHTSNHRP